MYRIILFLLLIALAAAGAAWVADQPGDVLISWNGGQAHPSLPVFVMLLGIVIVAAILAWTILVMFWRLPERIRRSRRPMGAAPHGGIRAAPRRVQAGAWAEAGAEHVPETCCPGRLVQE